MDWNKCLYFSNNIKYNNKKYENSVCKKHKNNKFDSDYLFICLSGEGYLDPTKLHNQTDIVSLEGIWEYKNKKKVVNLQFPRELLFSFIDNIRNVETSASILSWKYDNESRWIYSILLSSWRDLIIDTVESVLKLTDSKASINIPILYIYSILNSSFAAARIANLAITPYT